MTKLPSASLAIGLAAVLTHSASAQNVGIGTTTPKSKLSVNGSTASGGLAVGDATYTSTTGTVAPTNGAIIQGNVGIGGTVPLAKLHVRSDTVPQLFVGPEEGTTDSIVRHYGMLTRANGGGAFFGYIGAGQNPTASSNTGAAIIAGAGKDISFFTGSNTLGNPEDPSNPTNVSRMTIRASTGNVGIGTVAPQSQVDIRGTTKVMATTGTQTGDFWNGTSNVNGFEVTTSGSDVFVGIQRAGAVAPLHLAKPAGAAVGDPFALFIVNAANVGSITRTAGGVAFNTTSDERLKEHIRPSAKGLSEVMKMQVSDYNYKATPNRPETGFIAQQLNTVFPDAVTPGGEDPAKDPWTVDYGRLTPVLAKAIQEQQAEIEALKAANAELKATNEKLASVVSEVEALKQAVATLRSKGEGSKMTGLQTVSTK